MASSFNFQTKMVLYLDLILGSDHLQRYWTMTVEIKTYFKLLTAWIKLWQTMGNLNGSITKKLEKWKHLSGEIFHQETHKNISAREKYRIGSYIYFFSSFNTSYQLVLSCHLYSVKHNIYWGIRFIWGQPQLVCLKAMKTSIFRLIHILHLYTLKHATL